MSKELDEKTERIAKMLGREGFEAVLLTARHNFAWLTGGGSNGIDLSREQGVASLLVTRSGRRFIFANNIEMPRMLAEEVMQGDFEPVQFGWQEEKHSSHVIFEKIRSVVAGGAAIATDLALFSEATPIEGKIAGCRYELTSDELQHVRKLGSDAGGAMLRVINDLAGGESETEAAEKLRHEFAGHGIELVVNLAAADERIGLFRHPVPGEKRWNKTLLLVACAKRRGLIVSLSRMVCAGQIPGELTAITESAAYVNACLLDSTRPGVTGAELYAEAAKAYAKQDFADEISRHHQGGAAGYKTREWVAHPHSAEVVHPAQAFAWNPSITGTKVEETCLTSGDNVEVITTSTGFPRIAVKVNGREYFSPGILSL